MKGQLVSLEFQFIDCYTYREIYYLVERLRIAGSAIGNSIMNESYYVVVVFL